DGTSSRRLHAFLMALGGVGLILVDARDDAAQRRVSLAHEAGHFIVEYLLPRRVVEHSRPDLLDVVDGVRPPTASERLSAILGDVPIGVHTHLLDNAAPTDRIDRAEWKARRVALELLAPKAVVLGRLRTDRLRGHSAVRAVLVDDFGLPDALADD